jgi:hypothetical protein
MWVTYKGWTDDAPGGLLGQLGTVTTYTHELTGREAVHALGSIHLYVNLALVDVTLTAADRTDPWVMHMTDWYLSLSPFATRADLRI